jgi:hypothetical protein
MKILKVTMTFFLAALLPFAWLTASSEATAQPATSLTREEAQRELLRDSMVIYIYGVALQQKTNQDDTVTIMLSGIANDGRDIRQCTKRLLHLPRERVLSTEPVKDFTCNGQQVQKFEIPIDTTVVEELYSRVRISDFESMGQIAPEFPTSVFLTVQECLSLGGEVKQNFNCTKTNVACQTTVKNTQYVACIDEGLSK